MYCNVVAINYAINWPHVTWMNDALHGVVHFIVEGMAFMPRPKDSCFII